MSLKETKAAEGVPYYTTAEYAGMICKNVNFIINLGTRNTEH